MKLSIMVPKESKTKKVQFKADASHKVERYRPSVNGFMY